jgi:hypothetical protein
MNLSRKESFTMQFLISSKGLSSLVFLVILTLLAATGPARADEEDDQYLSILTIIEQGDALNAKGKIAPALEKYREAQKAIFNFQKTYPQWNTKVVAYRLHYLGDKTDALAEKVKVAAAAPAQTQAASGATAVPTAESLARVELLQPGMEPRAVLRYHPKVGDKHTVNMLMKMSMGMTVAGNDTPEMKMPRMSTSMDVTVTEISQDADISYDIAMTDAGVADDPDATPALADAMKSAIGGFKGVTGKATMSNRGISEKTELKLPKGADPQMHQMMDSLKDSISSGTMMLPDEAVGPGAKWRVKQKHLSQGLNIDQTTTYELLTVDKDQLTAKATIEQEAANQKIQSPAMPTMKIDLDKLTGAGTGNFTVDLSEIMPPEGNVDDHTEMLMGMGAGAQKQSMAMKMDVSVHLETK